MIPLRIIMTAIAASKRAVTLERARDPALPKILIILFEAEKIAPAIKTFKKTATKVGTKPYSSTMIMDVVKTAGPTIEGVPIGTAPISAEDT